MTAEQVAPGVWRAGTRYVNWYAVDAGSDGVTIVDAGFPRYDSELEASLHRMGRSPSDVRAVVLTHGHIDHIGFADVLADAGARVHLHPADRGLADAPKTNRSDSSLLPYLRWPATWAFLAHAIAQGATRPRAMPETVALTDGSVAEVPGRPTVTHTPGHTDGSCVLEFREHGVVFVGDLLCTISPATGRSADPQLQTRGSNTNSAQAMQSLDQLAGIEARTVLPGHGGPWLDGVEAAAASARRIGCR